MEAFVKTQRDMFVCFSHTKYSTYITGEAPNCDGEFVDYMTKLTFNGKKLVYRRERFNETLPSVRYGTIGIREPFRVGSGMRTGLSIFKPEGSPDVKPFKVYKSVNDKMVLDQELTAKSASFKAISEFSDTENALSKNPLFHGDSAIVEKTGFHFKVAQPNKQIIKRYDASAPGEENESLLRAPKAKIYISWDK